MVVVAAGDAVAETAATVEVVVVVTADAAVTKSSWLITKWSSLITKCQPFLLSVILGLNLGICSIEEPREEA